MIEEITFKNVLSYKDEVTLSFEAVDDTFMESSHVRTMADGTRLLRLGVVYGANASGKSNLLKAINALRLFWENVTIADGDKICIEPFKLDLETPYMPSVYTVKFWVNGKRYIYELETTRKIVTKEFLSFYDGDEPVFLFRRTYDGGKSVIEFNESIIQIDDIEKTTFRVYCLVNMSVFAARSKVNISLKPIDEVRAWINGSFAKLVDQSTDLMKSSIDLLDNDNDFHNYIVDFLKKSDFNINEFNTVAKRGRFFEEGSLEFIHSVKNARGEENYKFGYSMQSDGTKKVLGMESSIYSTVKKNSFLMIDEFETSIHPDLSEYMLERFLEEKNDSQLLISTHSDYFLYMIDDLLRKDNFWFVEKKEDGSSDLYSLVEFKGIDEIKDFAQTYRNGRFGALPNIKR